MNTVIILYLEKTFKRMDYYNNMAPFPVYETEHLEDIKNKIKELKMSKIDYDALPISACSFCHDLRIEVDDLHNDYCMRCGTINEITIYKDIEEYSRITGAKLIRKNDSD